MKTIKLSFLLLIMLNTFSVTVAQNNQEQIEEEDIQNLLGDWSGTITYLDYTSNKPFSMPSKLGIKSKKKNRKLILRYTYPNEPKANSKGKLKISKDRTSLNGKSIFSRSKTDDENAKIIAEYLGKDGNDNAKAKIRNIYIIGSNKFIIRKEVQFEGSEEWIMRNEFNFTKNK